MTLQDVETWMKRHVVAPTEPVKSDTANFGG